MLRHMGLDRSVFNGGKGFAARPVSEILDWIKCAIVENSLIGTVHPLGFYVVKLPSPQSEDWRFHFWEKGERKRTGIPATIHNHDCVVESLVLLGSLTNIVYEIEPDRGGNFGLFAVHYGGDRYAPETQNKLVNTKVRVGAREICRSDIAVGESYLVERFVYHEAVVPEGQYTATLARMSARVPGSVHVLGDPAGFPDIEFNRLRLENHDLLAAVNRAAP